MPQDCWSHIFNAPPFSPKRYKASYGKVAKFKKGSRRKRRNARFYDTKYAGLLYANRLLGSQMARIYLPNHVSQQQQFVLDALTTRLPLLVRTPICGYQFRTLLVGVIYRHAKLVWLIYNPQRNELCLSSHFYADVRHLLENLRHQFPDKRKALKYNRQSFNNATCFQALNQSWISLSTLGAAVTEFSPSDQELLDVQKFLQMTDHSQNLFRNTRQTDRPFLTHNLAPLIKGWKSFERTTPLSGKCGGGKRSKCTCAVNMKLVLHDMPTLGLVSAILRHTPSSIKNEEVHAAFKTYVQQNFML